MELVNCLIIDIQINLYVSSQAITGISLISASNKLFSGGKDRTVRVWDCSSGQCVGSVVTDSEVGCLVSEGPWLFVGLQNAVKV